MKPVFWLSLLLITVFVLGGCATLSPTQEVHLPSPTNLPATDTVAPTSTVPPAVTETSSPTATQKPLALLNPESVKETVQPLLQDPMDCAVPCFWGITPGKTRLDEVRAFFSPLGLTHKEGTDPNSGKYVYSVAYESGMGRDSSVIFYTSNSLVENIEVTPEITKQKEGSPREWIAYSPETLIKRYGSPSRVEFTVGSGPNIGMDMIMYFDTSDLIVHYSGYNMTPESFCPLMAPFDFVRLWIGPNPPDTPSFDTVPLEKATSLTMDQFTQLMKGDPQNACFTVKGEVSP
jgi:hypothetical protein